MEFKYYLSPHSHKYLKIDHSNDISVWNVYSEEDDSALCIQYQNGATDLSIADAMDIGRILEIDKQVQKNQREYDPYILWSADQKKWYLP